ncbi:Transforming growth factor beta regulator 1 [Aphelenchoides besseyi]|nr:Transforming growth factor beta regulator 1 [Aphelenchoides besseyi]
MLSERIESMATNSGTNQNFYRRGPSTGGLPPVSDLLSPQLSSFSSAKNRLHSVASPSTAPTSPYNAYQSPSTSAEAERLTASQPPTQQPMDIVITRPMDPSHLLMPPPKVASAPSVMAAVKASQEPQSPTISTTAKRKRPSTSQRAQQQRARQLKQQEVERLRCQEERAYLTKFMHLRKTVRALVFKNGALADEVARLKMQIDICKEETKMVAKRVQHHERNQIRRAQTHQRKALARAQAAANNNPSDPSQSSPAD